MSSQAMHGIVRHFLQRNGIVQTRKKPPRVRHISLVRGKNKGRVDGKIGTIVARCTCCAGFFSRFSTEFQDIVGWKNKFILIEERQHPCSTRRSHARGAGNQIGASLWIFPSLSMYKVSLSVSSRMLATGRNLNGGTCTPSGGAEGDGNMFSVDPEPRCHICTIRRPKNKS